MTSAKSISSMRWTSTHAATPAIDSHTTGRNRLRTCLGTLGIRSTYNPLMSLFANLVAVSQRVGATSARLAKVRELAACLRAVEPSEIDIAVHYLSGEIPQGRFGIGYATLRKASEQGGVASTATLTIDDVDRSLAEVAGLQGLRLCDEAGRSTAVIVRAGDPRRAGIPDAPAGRRAAPGRARRRHGRCDRRRRRPYRSSKCAARRCMRRISARSRAPRSREGSRSARAVSARAVVADRADAGADRGRRRRSADAARRRGRVRMEDGRCAHPGAQSRRRRAHLHAQL